LDPDYIIIGEIRDPLAADIAIQAAITGHTVLTTIHVDKVEDIPQRFAQLALSSESKISLATVSAALTGLISQRLVKKLHPDTKFPVYIHEYYQKILMENGLQPIMDRSIPLPDEWSYFYVESYYPDDTKTDIKQGYYKGYDMSKNGRTVIAEVVEVDEGLKAIIGANGEAQDIRKYLTKLQKEQKHISMLLHAVQKMNRGIISLADIRAYIGG
jgi:type II secretory ATPase GspE/PulE/Tfp pilus assembly ATPase PilB-like protein